jgi:hypothetical protein
MNGTRGLEDRGQIGRLRGGCGQRFVRAPAVAQSQRADAGDGRREIRAARDPGLIRSIDRDDGLESGAVEQERAARNGILDPVRELFAGVPDVRRQRRARANYARARNDVRAWLFADVARHGESRTEHHAARKGRHR